MSSDLNLSDEIMTGIINRARIAMDVLRNICPTDVKVSLEDVYGEESSKFAGVLVETSIIKVNPYLLLYVISSMTIYKVVSISYRDCWLFLGTSGYFDSGHIKPSQYITNFYEKVPIYEMIYNRNTGRDIFLSLYHESYPEILDTKGDITDMFAPNRDPE